MRFIGGAAALSILAALVRAAPGIQNTGAQADGKPNIAVITLKNASGVEPGEAEVISDRLRSELFNTGAVNVMERDQMQEVLKEQGFQQSGACTEEACLVQMGQMLGVERLLVGSIGRLRSMYLVNLRMIDVRTARMVKAVSRDVKGDLEEVVDHLPTIARELVGPPPSPKKETEQIPAPGSDNAPPPPEEAAPAARKPGEAVTPTDEGKKKERNKNRFGIRTGVMFFGRNVRQLQMFKTTDSYGSVMFDTTLEMVDSRFDSVGKTPAISPSLMFMIKAGPFLTVDIGGGWTQTHQEYRSFSAGDTTMVWANDLRIYSFLLGLSFVKRWYPVKLNIGAGVGLNVLDYSRNFTVQSTWFGTTDFDTTSTYLSANASYEFRIGPEFMIGKHFGVSTDFVFRHSRFVTFPDESSYYDDIDGTYYYEEYSLDVTMPSVAFGLGVRYYF